MASDQLVLVLCRRSKVVRGSKLVGVFTESSALTSQEVIVVGAAAGIDDLSLA